MVTLEWNTATEWDNAVSESDVHHPSGTVLQSVEPDNFDSYATGSTPPAPWTVLASNGVVTGSQSYSGSQSWEFTGDIASHSGALTVLAYSEGFPAKQYSTVQWVYRETTNSYGHQFRVLDSAGNEITTAGTGNPQVGYWAGSDWIQLVSGSTVDPSYQEWRRITLTFDWANSAFDILWEDLTGLAANVSATGQAFYNGSAADVGRMEVVQDDRADSAGEGFGTGGGLLDSWVDDMSGILSEGSLITAEKVK